MGASPQAGSAGSQSNIPQEPLQSPLGGQLRQSQPPGGGATPPAPGPSMLPNQQVAPLTPEQLQAIEAAGGQFGLSQSFMNQALGQQGGVLGGSLMSPNNPYLAEYYNAAAGPMIANYQEAIAPNIMQNAAQTGTLGSAGQGQAFENANTALSTGLADLSAGIYSPAYQQGVALTEQAAQNAPNLAQGAFGPAQQLYGFGQYGQQQGQNVLDTAYNNQYQQAMWPFQELNFLGQGLGLAAGGGSSGSTITTSPYQSSGK